MAIIISDNYDYKGKLPDFDRQEYATIADMKAVKKAKMPEMYIGYCLEDHKVYLYNKNNENDDTLGYWREFGAGGSSSESIQKTTLPEASESELGKIYQYIGDSTQGLINGYFYECAITGSAIETHVPQTVAELIYDIEHYPTGTIEVNTGSDPEELDCLLNYYIYKNTIYKADNETGDISTDTAITTDEMVASEQLEYDVDAPVYGWVQKDVQPSISSVVSQETFTNFVDNPPFDFLIMDHDPDHMGDGYLYKVYVYTQNSSQETIESFYIYDNQDWVLLGSRTTSREGVVYEVNSNFTTELYENLIAYNMPTVSSMDASDIPYDNLDHPSLSNVGAALDNILAKIYYVEPKINSFTMSPATTEYEIGASVSNLVFNWTTNKEITTQTLTDCTLADATVRTATAAGPYTSNKTFTLSIGDGENTATSSKSISFKHKVYWGSAAEPNGAYDSAFILGLSNKKFATNYKGTYSMTVAQDEFGYFAYPSSWGTVTDWWISGFSVDVYDCGEVSFTNASGNTTTFRVVRTTQPSLGAISPEIK